jgi:hypothetical protein
MERSCKVVRGNRYFLFLLSIIFIFREIVMQLIPEAWILDKSIYIVLLTYLLTLISCKFLIMCYL